eukprot:Phypoly_transcript_11408.p1 GENE.Phypoly_transcript_11408~~Phypoly_transcript_11408.p1  ORF type:complete len:277 (+),score=41.57 Phypoly_transcript_11408:187-1017(+)
MPQEMEMYAPSKDTLDIKQEFESFSDFAVLPISSRVSAHERKWAVTHRLILEKDHFLANLKSACRAHHVTVNAALCAALCEAMDMECATPGTKNTPTYLVGTAVHVLGGNSSQICSLNVTGVTTEIKNASNVHFWELAQTYNNLLKKKIANRQFNISMLDENLEYHPHELADSAMFDTQGRVLSFSISNVGDANKLLNKKSHEEAWAHPPFKIEDTFCTASLEAIGPCFLLAVMTFNGNMSLSIAFPVPTYERSLLQRLLDSAIAIAIKNSTSAKM